MPRLEVVPIGFESLGVRSMCTFIQTPDVGILIDAGVALGPRFSKPPHPREYEARAACRSKIRKYASRSDVLIVSHYHNDHHTPSYTDTVWLGSSAEESETIYRDKIVIAKDVRNMINFAQRRRGWMFQRFVKRIGSKCQIGDGASFEYGGTKIKLSAPVPHGEETSGLGWVIMTSIESEEEKIMHASDVQGPMSDQTTNMILKENASLLILGGPPSYLAGTKVNAAAIQKGFHNAAKIAGRVPTVFFEHHVLRSENWREEAKIVYDGASAANHKLITAAEHMGMHPNLLESKRLRLYEDDPPSETFLKWCKLPRDKREQSPPPI